jgi:hypothetical protein
MAEGKLQKAAASGDLQAISSLLDDGTNLLAKNSSWGYDALTFAAYTGHCEAAMLLIDRGADLSATCKWGFTPLHQACKHGQVKMIRELVRRGADMEDKQAGGRTPLKIAEEYKQVHAAKAIQELQGTKAKKEADAAKMEKETKETKVKKGAEEAEAKKDAGEEANTIFEQTPLFAKCTIPDSLKEGGNMLSGAGTGIGTVTVQHNSSLTLRLTQLPAGGVAGLGVCRGGYKCTQPRWQNAWTLLSTGSVSDGTPSSEKRPAKFGEGSVVKVVANVDQEQELLTLRWVVDGAERRVLSGIPMSEPLYFCAGSFDPHGATWEEEETNEDSHQDGEQASKQQHGRFGDADTSSAYQGKLRLPKGYTPPCSCKQFLLTAATDLNLEEVADVVEDLDVRMGQLGCYLGTPEYERRYCMFAYTYEAIFLENAQQLYSILNADLRSRSNGRFKLWMPFIFFMMSTLNTVPDTATTVYKGMQQLPPSWKVDGTAKIHWSGFSSTSTNKQVACGFASQGGSDGVLLKIKVVNAKDVQPYSWFGDGEKELILSPNMQFLVTKPLYQQDGVNCLDLQQVPSDTVWS